MANNNIQEVFQAAINDNPCRQCVRNTISRAKRGQKFYDSDFAAKLDPKKDEDVAIWVKRHLIAK